MEQRLLGRRAVLELLGISNSTLYRWIEAGHFPRPVRVGPNTARWLQSDLATWLEKQHG